MCTARLVLLLPLYYFYFFCSTAVGPPSSKVLTILIALKWICTWWSETKQIVSDRGTKEHRTASEEEGRRASLFKV